MQKNNSTDGSQSRAWMVLVVLLGLIAIGGGWFFWGSSPPQQIGSDPEVYKTVDALYTAVTANDAQRLGECESRLHALREAGKLPQVAASDLDAIIDQARSGSWSAAAKRLYSFMRGQRRTVAENR